MPATHFGPKLEDWRQKTFHIFHFLRSDMDFGIVNPFWWKTFGISSEKRCLLSMPFPLQCSFNALNTGQYSFSHLLNPEWSIQISRVPAVCKANVSFQFLMILYGAYGAKNNCCLFERLLKVKKNGVLLFGISFFVLGIFDISFVLCK